MNKIQKLGCICEKPELQQADYRASHVGTDKTGGRNAEVSILQCRLCQRIWLQYKVDSENNPGSGRWYKGIITKKNVAGIKPENAVGVLEKLDWYIFGGEYFKSEGTFGQGKLNVD